MAILNKTGITNGGTIQAEHVTRTIDALTGVSTDTIVATGSFTGPLTGTASFATTASAISITNTTSGTGPYYVTFVDGVTGAKTLRADSTANALAFNATTNTLTTTSSYALTASHALNSSTTGGEYMTLRLSSGVITSVTSGSTIYVGTETTSSQIGRVGVMLPYDCLIVSASVYLNTPSLMNTTFETVSLNYDVNGSPSEFANFADLDPKNGYIDANSVQVVNGDATATRWINVAFTPTGTATGRCFMSADILIKKT
jgi:hypothetical protein